MTAPNGLAARLAVFAGLAGCSILGFSEPTMVVTVTPALSASFAGQDATHSFSASVADDDGIQVVGQPPPAWTVTPAGSVTVDTGGVVTVPMSAPAGDYIVRASVARDASTAIVRVLPRPSGKLVFVANIGSEQQVFVKDFANDDDPVQITTGSGSISALAVDGSTETAFFARSLTGGGDIFSVRFDGSALTNLTNSATSSNFGPTVDPATHDVFFSQRVSGIGQIFRMRPDGTGPTQVSTGAQNKSNPAVSPDGQKLAWSEQYPGFNQEIVTASISGAGQVRFTDRSGNDGSPFWLTNSRVLYTALVGLSFDIVAGDVSTSTQTSVLNSADGEQSASAACSPNAFTYIGLGGGQATAIHLDMGTMLRVPYRVGDFFVSQARRVCQ